MPKRIIYAIIFALSFILSSAISTYAQNDTIKLSSDPDFYAITLKKDIPTAEKIMKELLPYKDTKTTGELMVMAAKKLLGNDYVAGTLEEGDSEDVRVYLSKTDCIIFVETCMNLALTVKKFGKDANFEKLCQMVRQRKQPLPVCPDDRSFSINAGADCKALYPLQIHRHRCISHFSEPVILCRASL